MKLPSPNVRLVEGITAPLPYLRPGRPFDAFTDLRTRVAEGAGFDFLAIADLMRPRHYVSPNPGVGPRSRHKCADAFDYDRRDQRVVTLREDAGGMTFWRTLLLCERQDGSLGRRMRLQLGRRKRVAGFFFDFTAAAESLGFERMPAWPGWERDPDLRESWHYQLTEGFTFDEARRFVYGRGGDDAPRRASLNDQVLGLADRGRHVLNLKRELAAAGLLAPGCDVGDVFGTATLAAVERLQREAGLDPTGLADAQTRRALLALVIRNTKV